MSSNNVNDLIAWIFGLGISNQDKPTTSDAAPESEFEKNLASTLFTIFRPIQDLGFYEWDTRGAYKNLEKVERKDIIGRVNLKGVPPQVLRVNVLNRPLPKYFKQLVPHCRWYNFPQDHSYIVPLYVAKEKGVKLDDVQFMLGGSTLEVFSSATIPDDETYLATIVPGTKIVIVAKYKVYEKNYSDVGFQFERFVTKGSFEGDQDTMSSIDHLNLMDIGGYRVLLSAESDGIDNKSAVEIKVSNPQYWGTKVAFQMISNGSSSLYAGSKYRGKLTKVKKDSLNSVVRNAMSGSEVKVKENRILECLGAIKNAVDKGKFKNNGGNKSFELSFDGHNLCLDRYEGTHVVLPREGVVRDLLGV